MSLETTTTNHTSDGGRPASEAYLTRLQAAAYLQIGRSTLAKLGMAGSGPSACKIGRSVRYRKSDLDKWMATHLTGVQAVQ